MKCSGCRFFCPAGRCRISPPARSQPRWPRVHGEDWCGAWKCKSKPDPGTLDLNRLIDTVPRPSRCRVARAMSSVGVETVAEAAAVPDHDLYCQRNFGLVAMREWKAALSRWNSVRGRREREREDS